MNRTLLVLAASLYQLDTIRCAKRLGYRVITLDNMPANPGHSLADKSFNIDTTDMEAVLQVARAEKVNGIIAACTDVAVPTAAYVAQSLGLPGIPLRSAQIACSKLAFRRFLGEHGFPVPECMRVDLDSLPGAELFNRGAWIIKPDRSSGSKGIFILRSAAEFSARLPETLSYSPAGGAILERFIEGFQGTCEGFMLDGKLALTFVLDRQTVPAPYVTTCGHHVPTRLPRHSQQTLFAALAKIWELLAVRDGPFDCDFIATGETLYVLEVSPRMGGNSISALLRNASGFDIVEYSVRQALGEEPELPSECVLKPSAVILFGVSAAGRLHYDLDEAGALSREPWVDALSLDKQIGDPVSPFINGRYRVGQAFVSGSSRDDLEERVLELKRRLALKAVPSPG